MSKIRFGIIGCGMIGDVHARAICSYRGAELVAVSDVSKDRASEFAAKYSAVPYTDYNEMLSSDNIDAVAICTPSGMHKDQAIAAIRAGKHVLCEKPMALTKVDAAAIRDELSKTDLKLSVMFQTRSVDDIKYLKGVIERGELGRLTLCDLYMKYWRGEDYFKVAPWRGTFAMDGGGALMNQGIHGVDIMHYLLGTPKLLGAKVKTLCHSIETEDTAVALVEYPGGALGVIEAATSTNPGFDRRIEISGTKGYAVIVDSMLEKLYVDGKMVIDKEIEASAGTASNPSLLSHERHEAMLDNFVKAINGEEELISDVNAGYNSVSFVEDVYTLSGATS